MELLSGKSPRKVLELAKKLLESCDCFCRGAKARNVDGRPVHPAHPDAVAWDIEAIVGICANPMAIVPIPLLELLDQAAILTHPMPMVHHKLGSRDIVEEPVWPYVAYESAGYVTDVLGYDAALDILNKALELLQE